MAVREMVVVGSQWLPFHLLALRLWVAVVEVVPKFGGNHDVVAPAVLDN
jgi:hypothetical protein